MSELSSFLSQIGGALSAQATGGQQGLQNFLATVARQQELELAGQQRADEQLRQQIFQKGRDDRQQAHAEKMAALNIAAQERQQQTGIKARADLQAVEIAAKERSQARQQKFQARQAQLNREFQAKEAELGRALTREEQAAVRERFEKTFQQRGEISAREIASRERIAEAGRESQELLQERQIAAAAKRDALNLQAQGELQAQRLLAQAEQAELNRQASLTEIERRGELSAEQQARAFEQQQAIARLEAELRREERTQFDVDAAKIGARVLAARAKSDPAQLLALRKMVSAVTGGAVTDFDPSTDGIEVLSSVVELVGGAESAEDLVSAEATKAKDLETKGKTLFGLDFRVPEGVDDYTAYAFELDKAAGRAQFAEQKLTEFSNDANLIQQRVQAAGDIAGPKARYNTYKALDDELETVRKRANDFVVNQDRGFFMPGAALAGKPQVFGAEVNGISDLIDASMAAARNEITMSWDPKTGMGGFELADELTPEEVDEAVTQAANLQANWAAQRDAVRTFSEADLDLDNPALKVLVNAGIGFHPSESAALAAAQNTLNELPPETTLRDLMVQYMQAESPQEAAKLDRAIQAIARVDPKRVASLRQLGSFYQDQLGQVATRVRTTGIDDAFSPLLSGLRNADNYAHYLHKYGESKAIDSTSGVVAKHWTDASFNAYVSDNAESIAADYFRTAQGDLSLAEELFERTQSVQGAEGLLLDPDVKSKMVREIRKQSRVPGMIMPEVSEVDTYNDGAFNRMNAPSRGALLPQEREAREQATVNEVMSPLGLSISENARAVLGARSGPASYFGAIYDSEERDPNYLTLRDSLDIFTRIIPDFNRLYDQSTDRVADSDSVDKIYAQGSRSLTGSSSAQFDDQERRTLVAADLIRSINLQQYAGLPEEDFQTLAAIQEQFRSFDSNAILSTFGTAQQPGVGVRMDYLNAAETEPRAQSFFLYSLEQLEAERANLASARQEVSQSALNRVVDVQVGDGETYQYFSQAAQQARLAELDDYENALDRKAEAMQAAQASDVLPSFLQFVRNLGAEAGDLPTLIEQMKDPEIGPAITGGQRDQVMGTIGPFAASLSTITDTDINGVREVFNALAKATPKAAQLGATAPGKAQLADFQQATDEYYAEAFAQFETLYHRVPPETPSERFRPSVASRLREKGYDLIDDRTMRTLVLMSVMTELRD